MRPSDPRNKKAGGDQADEDDDEDDENLCEADFEIGQFLKDFLVPKAVLYFTGELVDTASYDDYDEEDEDEEGDEDDFDGNEDEHDDEDEEDDGHQSKKPHVKNGRGGDASHKRPSKGRHNSPSHSATLFLNPTTFSLSLFRRPSAILRGRFLKIHQVRNNLS